MGRQPRRVRLAGLAALAVVLSACGSATTTTDAGEAGRSPGRSQAPSPSPAPVPHWPAQGCATHSRSVIDYAADSHGAPSRRAAMARYVDAGTHVVPARRTPHGEPSWLVVKDDGEIVRAVYVEHFDGGWLVSGVEQCSG
ncbi:hypothetical protein [Nocardioides panaciterrulae]|uniref:Lipoprotein n=1 Tax=Nocardioides panaciterrulae TaxID=661492 RepID=A0A7Y9E7R1_9ACTN|nr:hypothetical protein [Nocardioides panaciterrulae]NYD42542.1 hypothetical protein [Nocardioides panaciterrulae]